MSGGGHQAQGSGEQPPDPGPARPGPGSPGGGATLDHAVLELLAEVKDLAGKLALANAWSMSDAQSRQAVRAGGEALAALESAWLGLVRDLDSRPDAVAGARAGQTARTFLVHALNRSGGQASADLRAARALDPGRTTAEGGLPAVAAAFAGGAVNRRHVDVAVGAANNVPGRVARAVTDDVTGATVADEVDAFLADQARQVCPDALSGLGRELLARLAPERADRYDPEAHLRRSFSMRVAPDGMTVGRFQLAAAQAARVRAALEAFGAPLPASEQPDRDGQLVLVADERTRTQRMADAFAAVADAALAHDGLSGAERARVMVIADAEQVADARRAQEPTGGAVFGAGPSGASSGWSADGSAGGAAGPGMAHCVGQGPIGRATLGLLACDASLQAVLLDRNGAVLHLGRAQRTASKPQRLALAARDRGCVIPGCTAPVEWCDAHHVTWWSRGGLTDVDAMALVCRRHHVDLHHGVWVIEMHDGVPWARPPSWINPDRPLLRNTVHHTLDDVRRWGEQLRLPIDGG